MFMRVYPVSYVTDGKYYLSSDELIINTTQIVAITIYDRTPEMREIHHRKKIEEIFDTKFDNLVIFNLEFSNHKVEHVIGPIDKFKNIK